MGGSSKSSVSTTNVKTTTTNTRQEDKRVAATDGALALGAGAQFVAGLDTNELAAFETLAGFVTRSLDQTEMALGAVQKQSETSFTALQELSKQKDLGDKSIITDIFPVAALVTLGSIAAFAFGRKQK